LIRNHGLNGRRPRNYLLLLLGWLILAGAPLARPAATGALQVLGEPGVQVFLDDKLQGVTTKEMGGLLIPKVPVGSHRLKVVRQGFAPRTIQVVVKAGETRIIKLPPMTAGSKSRGGQSSKAPPASVLYVFLPQLHLAADILVTLDDQAFAALSKSQFCVRREIPPGRHTALGDIRPFPVRGPAGNFGGPAGRFGRFQSAPASSPPPPPPPPPTRFSFNSAPGKKLYLRVEPGPVIEQGLKMGLVPEAGAKAYTKDCLEAKPTAPNRSEPAKQP